MHLPRRLEILSLVISSLTLINCACYDPSPAFPPPNYGTPSYDLKEAFDNVTSVIEKTFASPEYDTTSFSLEVTSSKETLFTLYHTAKVKDPIRPGAPIVNGTSAYRIASCTKVFTVLGILQQHAKGNLHLDDALNKYLPELEKKQTGTLPWHDITLRALGSQLSGIPGDLFQSDLLNDIPDPGMFGLPPKSRKGLPTCDEYSFYTRPCEKEDLIEALRAEFPTFAPAQQPSYCNVGFEILGLVLEKVSKMPYSKYIHNMLKELDIEGITFDKPDDDIAVLPASQSGFWDVEEGVQRPTGGLYSGSSSLSAFLRYVLTHYNGITTGALNWLHPASYGYGMSSFIGMPWEIFRSGSILKNSAKPVTFVTKSGGLPAYTSIIMIVPEYDLGITILVGGDGRPLSKIRQIVTEEFIPAVELLAQAQLEEKYAGIYAAAKKTGLDSSLELSHSIASGLYISKFVSNGTDVLRTLLPLLAGGESFNPTDWYMQLVPTLLFADPEKQKGELWRALLVPQKRGLGGAWEDFCINQVDTGRYAGKVVNEFVFWTDADENVTRIDLPAWEVTLHKQDQSSLSSDSLLGHDEIAMIQEL